MIMVLDKELTRFLEQIRWFSPLSVYHPSELASIANSLQRGLSLKGSLIIDLSAEGVASCFGRVENSDFDRTKNWLGASYYKGEFGQQLGLAEDVIWQETDQRIGEDGASNLWTECFSRTLDHLLTNTPHFSDGHGKPHWMAAYFVTNDYLSRIGGRPENPFKEMNKLYKLGLCPVGIDNLNLSQLIIWHPPISQQ